MSDKKYLSPTQLESYCRCPEAYRRRYLEGEKIPPGIALLKGSSFHGAARNNFLQKIASHVDLDASEIRDMAGAEFDLAASGGYSLTEEEIGLGASKVIGKAKDDAVSMAHFHALAQAPEYQPVLVEERIRIELPMVDLLGIIDLADDKDRVIDFKTAGRRKSQAEADNSVQLSCYASSFKAKTGKSPSEIRLDCVVKTKTSMSRDLLTTDRGSSDFEALANRINAVAQAIQSGSFPPATPGAWWCSPTWCGYWHTCKYVNSARLDAAEKGNGS